MTIGVQISNCIYGKCYGITDNQYFITFYVLNFYYESIYLFNDNTALQ